MWGENVGGNPPSASFTDTNETNGTTYHYWVKAGNSGGLSGFSSMATGMALAFGSTHHLSTITGHTHKLGSNS